MAISEAHAGRRYPPTEPYEVSAAKIAEFAAALGDDNPRYCGPELIAPPTRTPWDSLNARVNAPDGLQLTLFEELGEG